MPRYGNRSANGTKSACASILFAFSALPATSGACVTMFTSVSGFQPWALIARSSMPCAVDANGTEIVLPFRSASPRTVEFVGTTIPLPLPSMLPSSTVMNTLLRPALRNAAPFSAPGKSAIAPKSSLPATISLVSGAPDVKSFHCTSYFTSWYLPVRGRYLSSRCSSRINRPPVAQLIVVSCVPIATRIVSACAKPAVATASDAASR